MNYERIVTYDNIETELINYSKSENYKSYNELFFNILNEFLPLVNQIFLLFINLILLKGFDNIKNPINNNFINFIAIEQFNESIYILVFQFDKLYNLYFNISKQNPEEYEQKEYKINISSFKNEIIIENLFFCINKKYIFKNLKCIIKKNQKIAITGENGSGKSVFLKILCGLLEYDGSIKIDGIELKNINKKFLYKILGNISKNNILLNNKYLINYDKYKNYKDKIFKVKNNIVFSNDNIFYNENITHYYNFQYKNLNIYVKQLLFFIDLFKNKSIIAIDNIFIGLDNFSKILIENYIKKEMKNKTFINVVNDISDLKNYDKIIFFKKNQNPEIGTFDELIKKKTDFYNYCKTNL